MRVFTVPGKFQLLDNDFPFCLYLSEKCSTVSPIIVAFLYRMITSLLVNSESSAMVSELNDM